MSTETPEPNTRKRRTPIPSLTLKEEANLAAYYAALDASTDPAALSSLPDTNGETRDV